MFLRAVRQFTTTVARGKSVPQPKVSNIFPAERIPVLEELFEAPVLMSKEMRAEDLAEVKGFVPPVLKSQIEASLRKEFNRPILATDWNRYEDPLTSHEQAARLIHHTLAIYSNVGRTVPMSPEAVADLANMNEEWIREECKLLLNEIETGSYERWESVESFISVELTDAQMDAVKPAIAIIGKNAWIHPRTKREVIQGIINVVTSTIQ